MEEFGYSDNNLEKIKNLCFEDLTARGYSLENKVNPI